MDEFDFELVHRSGQRHNNADSMSRIPCRRKDCLCMARAAQNVGETVEFVSDIRAVRQSTCHDIFIDCDTTLNLVELFGQLDDAGAVQTVTEQSRVQNSSVKMQSGDGRPPPWPSWNNELQAGSQSTSQGVVKMVNEKTEMNESCVGAMQCAAIEIVECNGRVSDDVVVGELIADTMQQEVTEATEFVRSHVEIEMVGDCSSVWNVTWSCVGPGDGDDSGSSVKQDTGLLKSVITWGCCGSLGGIAQAASESTPLMAFTTCNSVCGKLVEVPYMVTPVIKEVTSGELVEVPCIVTPVSVEVSVEHDVNSGAKSCGAACVSDVGVWSEELVEVPLMVTPVSEEVEVEREVNSAVNNSGVVRVCDVVDRVGDEADCILSGRSRPDCALYPEIVCDVPRASLTSVVNVVNVISVASDASLGSSLSDVKWISNANVKPAAQLGDTNVDYSSWEKNQFERLEETSAEFHQETEDISRENANEEWETECEEDGENGDNNRASCCEIRVVNAVTSTDVTEADVELTRENITRMQEGDEDIKMLLQRKKVEKDKPPWDEIASCSPDAKALWQQWDRLKVVKGMLCRRFDYLDGRPVVWQIIVPFKLRKSMFKAVHEGMTGGHMGRRRTQLQIQQRAYWPGWTADVSRYLKQCSPCAQYHRGNPPRNSALKPFPAGDVWETVSIDITGPHPRSRHGNVYLLTIMDHFSKWADAIPIPNHTAVTVARVLFNRVFVYRGVPLRLLSDQGPELESNLMSELCKWMGVQKLRTTPYKASTNGMVERYHRSLNSILAKIICDNQRDWCERAPVAAAAYRASVHETTGYSPNFLTYGKENRAPVDILFGCPPNDDDRYLSTDDYVEQHQVMLREVYTVVRQHLEIAATRRKNRYDCKVKQLDFQVGNWVWYLYPRRRVQLSPKWQKFWTGPYLIVRVLPPNDVVLQKSRRAKSFVVHKDKIKLFHGEPPASWMKLEPEKQQPDESSGHHNHDTALVDPVVSPVLCDVLPVEPVSVDQPADHRNIVMTPDRDIHPTDDCGDGDNTGAELQTQESAMQDLPTEDINTQQSPALMSSQDCVFGQPALRDQHFRDGRSPRTVRPRHRPVHLRDFVCGIAGYNMSKRDRQWDQPRRCPVKGCQKMLSRAASLRRHCEAVHPEFQPSESVTSDDVLLDSNAPQITTVGSGENAGMDATSRSQHNATSGLPDKLRTTVPIEAQHNQCYDPEDESGWLYCTIIVDRAANGR